ADPYTPGDLAPGWSGAAADEADAEAERAAAEIAAAESVAATETSSGLLLPGSSDVAGLLAEASAPPTAHDTLRELAERASGSATGAPGGGSAAAETAPDAAPRERPSRAHAAAFLADGRIATTDLGFDLVRFWRVGASGLVLDHEVTLPFGVGPRHLFAHPSGHLHVVTEFSCEVWTLRRTPGGRWDVVSAAPTGAMDGDTGAELAPSRDRRFLYAALRGSDTIAVLRVAGEGERLEPVALAESGVRTPRHHVVVGDTLLVAGQRSDEIVSLPVDERTGAPGPVRRRFETPCPQHILPVGR
ncbi:MAG: lactonase family protein, partial [Microbacterium sp.]